MKSVEQPALITLKNMLLATDISSAMALRYARVLGREDGAQARTLHVSDPDNCQLLGPEAFATTFNGIHDASQNAAE